MGTESVATHQPNFSEHLNNRQFISIHEGQLLS